MNEAHQYIDTLPALASHLPRVSLSLSSLSLAHTHTCTHTVSIEHCVFSVKAKLHANSETFLRPFQRSIVADSLSHACVSVPICVCLCMSVCVCVGRAIGRAALILPPPPPLSFGCVAVWLLIVTVPGSSAGWQLYCRSFRTVRYALPQLRIVVVQRA